ncbi:MAG: cysteine desulfurase-like protein [Planctomycetaceae bacterium]
MPLEIEQIRRQFPALARVEDGRAVAYFDGPAGSQVPQRVIDAVSQHLTWHNANRGAAFASSRESDAILNAAHQSVADFLGAADPGEVAFGANMTSLTFAFSRALAKRWRAGDEVIVSRLDHDANFTPWVLAARDAGAIVHEIPIHLPEGRLDLDHYRALLNERTRLVAVGYASNLSGTVNPVEEMVAAAHKVGAVTFIDAVHFAPHRLIDVTKIGCDVLACSAYKFFGPHVGILWGRRALLESIEPYKLRPAPDALPGRWMTGTQNHEGIAGTAAAIEYLADIGRRDSTVTKSRREALSIAFGEIEAHENRIFAPLLHAIAQRADFQVWGPRDVADMADRVPTLSITHQRFTPRELAEYFARRGLWTWAGNHYAVPFSEAAGLEPHGTLRIGLLHYNTAAEVERLLQAIDELP